MVRALNAAAGRAAAAYTFDAGPNPVLYLLEKDQPLVLRALLHYFPPAADAGSAFLNVPESAAAPSAAIDSLRAVFADDNCKPGGLQRLICTRLGPGAQILPSDQCLIDLSTGLPKL
jgi:diphosphomevalonate decarboxylase